MIHTENINFRKRKSYMDLGEEGRCVLCGAKCLLRGRSIYCYECKALGYDGRLRLKKELEEK